MDIGTADQIRAVRSAEDEFRAALIAADANRLDEILADEYVYGHGSGCIDHKAGYIRLVTDGTFRLAAPLHSAVSVKVYGDAAVLTGDIAVTKDEKGGRKVTPYLFVTVWRRTTDRWRLVHYQHTRKGAPHRTN